MRTLWLLATVLLACPPAAAPQQSETFHAETRLVLVPVVVHDKAGAHLPGLAKEKFRITQDGKEQAIAVFEEVHAKKQALAPEPMRPSEFSNAVAEIGGARALTVIAVDLINTPPLAVGYLKKDLLKYIGGMAADGEPTALVTLEPAKTRVVYDFTTDPKLLAEAVKRLQTRQTAGTNTNSEPVTEATYQEVQSALANPHDALDLASLERMLQAFTNAKTMADKYTRMQQAQTRRDTLDAIRALATSLKSFPGRKSLIWISGGLPYSEEALQLTQTRDPTRVGTGGGGLRNAPPGSTGGSGSTGAGNPPPAPSGGNANNPFRADPNTGDTLPAVDPSRDLILQRGLPSTEALNDHTLAWGVLNDGDVAVYPVDARRLVNTAFDVINPADQKYSSQAMNREMSYFNAQEIITTFENIAAATGGKPCYSRTDLENCFREAVADGESYYLLGYYIPKQTSPGWHKLQVKTSLRDTNLRARNGFLLNEVETDAAPAVRHDIQAALSTSMNAIAVPFRGKFLPTTERNGKKAVPFELQLAWQALTVDQANGNRIALEFVAVAYTPAGDPAARTGQTVDRKLQPAAIAQIQQAGMRYRNVLELSPGDYTVQFVVRDNLTGRMGSVRTPLKVE